MKPADWVAKTGAALKRAGWFGALDEDLFEAGLDSLMLVLWISELEREFGVRIPPSEISPARFSRVKEAARLMSQLVEGELE